MDKLIILALVFFGAVAILFSWAIVDSRNTNLDLDRYCERENTDLVFLYSDVGEYGQIKPKWVICVYVDDDFNQIEKSYPYSYLKEKNES